MKKRYLVVIGAIVALIVLVSGVLALKTIAHTDIAGVVWTVINSAISLTIVGTFVSAYAGTWGAQKLAEGTARRRELLTEIRRTNAAIGLAANVANTYITTKKQLVKDLVAQFEIGRAHV